MEKYIQLQLSKYKFINQDFLEINTATSSNNWKSYSISIKNLTVIHFDGNRLPGKVNWDFPTLFIPDSPNYPDIDLLLWDPTSQILYPTQITIVDPISKHGNKFFDIKDTGATDKLWIIKSQNRIKKIQFVWIGTNDSVSSGMKMHYFAKLDTLDSTFFPLIKFLNYLK